MTKRVFVVTRRRALVDLEKSAGRLSLLTVDAFGSNLGQRRKIPAIRKRRSAQRPVHNSLQDYSLMLGFVFAGLRAAAAGIGRSLFAPPSNLSFAEPDDHSLNR